jgi:hypothetical protein
VKLEYAKQPIRKNVLIVEGARCRIGSADETARTGGDVLYEALKAEEEDATIFVDD